MLNASRTELKTNFLFKVEPAANFGFTFTVWKFKNSSATQILREIKIGHFGASITVILTVSEALDLNFAKFQP